MGTLIILYLLFPLFSALYKKLSINKTAKRILFPSVTFATCFLIVVVLGQLFPEKLYCANNSFTYYSFINQLPGFTLGIVLFDYYNSKEFDQIRLPWLKFLILAVFSIYLFFCNIRYAFALLPFVFSLSFFYLFVWTFSSFNRVNEKGAIKWFLLFGKYNYAIYLTHPLIVYECSQRVVYPMVFRLNLETKIPPDLRFVIWLFIALLLCLFVAIGFQKLIDQVLRLFRKKTHKEIKGD